MTITVNDIEVSSGDGLSLPNVMTKGPKIFRVKLICDVSFRFFPVVTGKK